MNYTASSVRAALETLITQKGLYSKDLENLVCPIYDLLIKDGRPQEDNICCNVPQDCQLAKEQKCKRNISILCSNKKTLYTTLSFRFTISDTNYDGFIDTDDSRLRHLIDRGDIVECDLAVA